MRERINNNNNNNNNNDDDDDDYDNQLNLLRVAHNSYSQTGCSFDGNIANFRRNIGI